MEPSIFIGTLVIVLIAYLVKGFTGFGPALILIPTLSYFYDPHQAIFLSTLLDLVAGIFLLATTFQLINWKSVFWVILTFFPGTYIGAKWLGSLDIPLFKKLLGLIMLSFLVLIWFNTKANKNRFLLNTRFHLTFTISFLAGIGGGLFGISGPLLVIYFKLGLEKAFFRAQLIAILVFGAAWRLWLYHSFNIKAMIYWWQHAIFFIVTFSAIIAGNHWQLHIDAKKFDRFVAMVLVLPSLLLIFS